MKAIIEKQILEWKEELAKQIKTKDQAEKVLADANRTILMIEGGIQAQVNLLQKIESESQPSGTVELGQQSGKAPSRK
ncbi:hypothetical protein [uncultured phage MedDCM-OCT-S04-C26]|nr:hypothetical protein [uncultured phage MedDCM-OCT-S04-C26]BAQ92128.1 hypothetical protein [uncultured Mediterranean phage uvMED]BAR20825.1 hypothetical protein [uncultured Mediterranean phage uvMED]BAR38520.1 hypothetical protein [uncultured Mediterranean phage uvMED]